METAQLTPALVVGALLALLLETVPGLKTWWTALTPERKQGINLLLIFVTTILFVLIPVAAGGPLPQGWNWLLEPLTVFLAALTGSQATHSGTKLLLGPKADG
jgi:hypothetical protein